jgi:hypothetical protein
MATAIAAVVAAIVLVTAVLPAEYGIDLLGTGRALGLTALAGANDPSPAPATAAHTAAAGRAAQALQSDTFEVELRPFEGVEYKYRLAEGASFVYSWRATEIVNFEFHGEPDGAPPKYFDSYQKGTAAEGSGQFVAAKAGIHGWFWENRGAGRVKVTLESAGFYVASTEYRDGERIQKTFAAK